MMKRLRIHLSGLRLPQRAALRVPSEAEKEEEGDEVL